MPQQTDVRLRVPRRELLPVVHGWSQQRRPQRGAVGHSDAHQTVVGAGVRLSRQRRVGHRVRAAALSDGHGREERAGGHLGSKAE